MSDYTHTLKKEPAMTARFLADYMAASEIKRRTIVRNCKYKSIARFLQHDVARPYYTTALINGSLPGNGSALSSSLRNGPHKSPFHKEKAGVNADAIDRFDAIFEKFQFGNYERSAITDAEVMNVGGVLIKPQIAFVLSRFTKTNKLRIGAASVRYRKGKPVSDEIAQWQAAFNFGYIRHINADEALEVEPKLCWLIDAYAGTIHEGPSNSVSKFNNIRSACESISERWDNIPPPPKSKVKGLD